MILRQQRYKMKKVKQSCLKKACIERIFNFRVAKLDACLSFFHWNVAKNAAIVSVLLVSFHFFNFELTFFRDCVRL